MAGIGRIGADAWRRALCAGVLVAAVSMTVATQAASASPRLAAQEVFATVKSVNTVTHTVVLRHFKTARVISSPTSTYSIATAKITAPNKWLLTSDPVLVDELNSKTYRKLLSTNPTATVLFNLLIVLGDENPVTHVVTKAPVWGNSVESVNSAYLKPGDLVSGFSAVSAAKTAQYELARKPVPLATLQDEAGHAPWNVCPTSSTCAPSLAVGRPPQTPAELLELILGQAVPPIVPSCASKAVPPAPCP